MDLHPIWPVEFDRSNLTSQIWLVKLSGNPLRLHCMPAWSNWVSSQWIYTQFDQHLSQWIYTKFDWSNLTGQIGWKSTEITLYACLVKLGIISMDLHPIWPVEFDRPNWVQMHWDYIVCLLKALDADWIGCKSIEIDASQIGCKSIEIQPGRHKAYNVISMENSTGQIWPGINYWSNWVEIHSDCIVCLPGRIWWS